MKKLYFVSLLTLVFATLKLTGVHNPTWWTVFSPFWIYALCYVVFGILFLICAYFTAKAEARLDALKTPEQRAAEKAAASARRLSEALRKQR